MEFSAQNPNRNRNSKNYHVEIVWHRVCVCVSVYVKLEMILLSHHYLSLFVSLSVFVFKRLREKKTIRILSFIHVVSLARSHSVIVYFTGIPFNSSSRMFVPFTIHAFWAKIRNLMYVHYVSV